MKTRTNKRQDIITAALRLLATEGAEKFTAANLAAVAGVSKANLFHHFNSLDDIVLEAFEQFTLGMRTMAPAPDMAFGDWLHAIGEETFSLVDSERDLMNAYVVFVAKALFDSRLKARIETTLLHVQSALRDAISALHPHPLTWDEICALADLILTTIDGLSMHAQMFPERLPAIRASWHLFADKLTPAHTGEGENQ